MVLTLRQRTLKLGGRDGLVVLKSFSVMRFNPVEGEGRNRLRVGLRFFTPGKRKRKRSVVVFVFRVVFHGHLLGKVKQMGNNLQEQPGERGGK